MVNEQKLSISPKIATKLTVWIGVFFLFSALSLLAWAYTLQRKSSLAELQRLAATNTTFLADLGLPYSTRLAAQLSEILHLGVGFYFSDSPASQWPPELLDDIRNLMESHTGGGSQRVRQWEIAVAPLVGQEGYLVLARNLEQDGNTSREWWTAAALPIALLALGCLALAFGLGRSIASPLAVLTGWLPNLRNSEAAEDSLQVPPGIVDRSDEIGQLAGALSRLQQELAEERDRRAQSEKMAALGRIATSLAHEVKNPAAAIRMHTDLLLTEPGSDTQENSSLSLIREEVDQITDLVNQWLYVSKSEPPASRPHDLTALLHRVAKRMRGLLEDRGVELKIESDGGVPLVIQADAPRIEQVFRNLIQNAIDAMPQGGEVLVRLQGDAKQVHVKLLDSGSGFSAEALVRFSEPFFSDKEGGMGIGLHLTSEVVRAHGGEISVANRGDSPGAVVTLSFPTEQPGK